MVYHAARSMSTRRLTADEMLDMPTRNRRRLLAALPALGLALMLGGCVYRVDVQQGNLLDDRGISGVQIGMTKSQVRFLLGTPVIEDSFQHDRWDYVYYLRKGSERKAQKRWLIVRFADDKVKELTRDVPFSNS